MYKIRYIRYDISYIRSEHIQTFGTRSISMYDSIIIGTGPAGLSAALNLKTYKKDFIWFGSKNLSDKVQKAEKIVNYPGFPMISGQELFERFDAHRQAAEIEITEKTVTNIMPAGDGFMVLADNEVYEARTLILCMGVMSAKQLDREDELLGKRLSYCATCDGMFYKHNIKLLFLHKSVL